MEKATIDKLLLSNIYIVVLATLLLFTKGKTFVESSSSSSSHPNDTATSCVAGERSALVDFKAGLRDPAYLLSSWKGDDCCKWKGVHCSTKNSHVVKLDLPGHGCDYNDVDMMMQVLGGNISSSLLGLQHLQYLNLSCNEFYGVQIPEFLGSLHKLRYIDLSRSTFSGRIPPQLGNLSNLRYLNLGRADYTYSMDITWLARLTSLEYLDLSGTNLSTIVHWLPVVNMLPSLNVLSLRSCNLRTGSASLHLSNLTFLEALDLSFNSFHRHITPNWFWELTSLKYLYIARSGFYGQFPEEIGNMTSIVELYLSSNYLVGMVPSNLKNLCSLQKFDVSNNNMSGSITEFFLRLPRCSWNKLTYMYQRSSNSTAILPTKLEPLSNLTYLSLGSNNLTGHVPLLIGKLTKLIYLDLSYNNLEGFIHEGHLSGLKSLESLWLSNLTLTMNLWWVPPSNLTDISLQSCLLGPKFPLWLRRIKRLEYLDISNTGISDTMPDWFWILASTAVALNMRQNKISGSLPPTMEFMTATAIGLSSNQFNGPIPKLPMSLNDLDLSENNFDGPLPLDFGAPNLETLILFDNSISGTIPSSLCKLRSLRLLDISDNKLTGSIPNCSADTSTTSKTSMSIINLSLRNNNLSGEFPSFLQYCEELVFLDLAHNHFFGTLPAWIREKLPYLAFLRLRSNSFYGHIPEELTKLDNLRYLDLAYNNITGSIPKSIVNWKEMTIVTDDYDDLSALHAAFNFGLGWTENDFTDIFTYTENFAVVTKGQERLYTGEIIYMVILDLSCNNLMGDIPEEIHRLVKLKNLNLSWNTFSGKIPVNIGALAQVESLDLSHNELSGEIPASLSDLTSLSRLNLSYNNLTGEVPSGDQLQTLEDPEYIYIGNPGLCGPSLLRKCLQPEPIPNTPEDHEDLNDMASFFIAMGSGYVMGIWVVFCTFLFKRKWRVRWYSICDGCYDWVYVQAAVTWASWTRKIFTKAESGR